MKNDFLLIIIFLIKMEGSSLTAGAPRVYGSLNELITKNKSFDLRSATHVIRLPNDGKIKINYDEMESFWTLYCNAVQNGETLSVLERINSQEIPLIVDVDFYYKTDELKRCYTQKDIKNLIGIYQDVIRETLVVENNRELLCVVLEKEEPCYKHDKPYDGIHLVFPDCVTDIEIQTTIIRSRVVEKITESGIFNRLELDFNDYGDIIDAQVPNHGLAWALYGSKSKPDSQQIYKISMIVDHHLETQTLEGVLNRDDFGKWHEIITPEFFNRKPISYYIPMWLSIQGRQGSMKRKAQTQSQIDGMVIRKINKHKHRQIHQQNYDPADLAQQLQDAEKLLEMLKPQHRDNYDTWVRTGYVLFCISKSSEYGLLVWRNWSRYSPKYVEGECEKKWNTFDDTREWTIATLIFWAKAQNPLKYKAWCENKINYYVTQAESGTHYDLGLLLKKLYQGKYVCAGIKDSLWFEFRDHRWHPIERGFKLDDIISIEMVKIMNKRRADYVRSTDGTDDSVEKKMKNLSKIIENLKQMPFKRALIEQAKILFYDETFLENLDENKNLMCFKNGVLDMTHIPWIFREGTPDDCIQRCTGVNFPTWLDAESEEVQETQLMLEKMFVNPRLRKFAIQTFSSILKGGNIFKHFPMMVGNTDGGKSNIQGLLMKCLGFKNGYSTTLNTSIATGKRTQSSGTTEDIESLKGIRAVFLQEPSPDEDFNLGVVKQLTGNDVLYSRGNYKKSNVITPQFKVFMSANALPSTKNSQDEAFFNRVRVIRCESRFIKPSDYRFKDIPESVEEQFAHKMFPADMTIEQRYDDVYIPGLIWIMAHELNNILTHGIHPPPEVLEATESYQRSNDVLRQFYNENIVKTNNEEDELSLAQIFMLFKDWYAQAFPNLMNRMPTRNDLQKSMEQHYGPPKKTTWFGITTADPNE